MQCFVCGSDSPGEVCNRCIRTEEKIKEESWVHKEGFLGSKKEELKVLLSSLRISGLAWIATSESGTNGRFDSFNHYLGNIEEAKSGTYNGKPCPVVHIKNKATGMERFILFPSLSDDFINQVNQAKK